MFIKLFKGCILFATIEPSSALVIKLLVLSLIMVVFFFIVRIESQVKVSKNYYQIYNRFRRGFTSLRPPKFRHLVETSFALPLHNRFDVCTATRIKHVSTLE